MSLDESTTADRAPDPDSAPDTDRAPITDSAVRPPFHLAVPVDDLTQAAAFYGGVLGLPRGAAGTTFVIEPYVRFAGEVGEQWTMFFYDPAGNPLEFKAFADVSQLFAH